MNKKLRRALVITTVLSVSAAAFVAGQWLFREEWFRTSQVRFESDVFNGYRWGQATNRPEVGIFKVYDLDAIGAIRGTRPIDYTPLRIMVVWLWGKWAGVHFPGVIDWREAPDRYAITLPMLRFNMICQLASSILVFLLIRMWVIRMDDAHRSSLKPPKEFRGVVRGMIGALLFWFNPAVIRSAQTYPQWDVWNMPFFLGALLLACADWWFAAGFCLAFGALLKGQVLLVTPIFLLWPIFQLRFDALLKFVSGLIMSTAMIVLPWLLATPTAITWLMLIIVAMALTTPLSLRMRIGWPWLIGTMALALLIGWPWKSQASVMTRLVVPSMLMLIALARFLPARLLPHLYSLAVAGSVFLMIPLYSASSTWFGAAFEYSTQKIMMTAVPGTMNLPSLLMNSYRWPEDPNFYVHVPLLNRDVVFRHLMLVVYAIVLIACSIGAVMHLRRNDSRFLVAVITPWLGFFMLLTQMNNRYLMWAAGFSALLAGVDLGMALLGCVVMVIAHLAIAGGMNMHLSLGTPEDIRMFSAITPHLAWPLLLVLAIYLYVSIIPRRLDRGAPGLQEG